MRLQYRLIIFIILLIWCAGIFLEWFLNFEDHLLLGLPFLQKTYSLVCHQEKAKLLFFDHGETLTCARCTGIYLGLLFTSIIVLFSIPKKELHIKFLFIAAAPMISDVILYSLNIYHYSKMIALTTGFLLGSVGFLYLYAGLNNLIRELKS
ncbi:MAG: DUF2085 domain-containing protein [Melioribacteraceae bacterium]